MTKSFKSIRKFINIRNLYFFIFKICVAVLLTLSLLIINFIIIFSIKPRTVPKVSSYIIKYLNKNPNVKINFDVDNSTLYFDSDLGLKYKIKDFNLETDKSKINSEEIIVNLDFVRLLFGRININDINLSDTNLKFNSQEVSSKKEFTHEKEEITAQIQKVIQKIHNSSVSIKRFQLNDFKINVNLNNVDNEIKILRSQLNLDFKNSNFQIYQNAIFNINNAKTNSRLSVICDKRDGVSNCKIDIKNINPNNFETFFNQNSIEYSYLSNVDGYFDGKFDFIFDNKMKLKSGNGIIKSIFGSFDFKNLFDEKLVFGNLIINVGFDNYFKDININSLTTNFGKTRFFMSMFIKEKKKYKSVDLNFDIQNTLVSDLRKLWPNFLDNDSSRPWVLKHIKSGNLPLAKTNMNFKYFYDNNKSGLQSINAEIDLDNILLEYDDYFPIIQNINGKAIFTKNDMKINIKTAKVLNSKITNGIISIDFNKNPKNVAIKANLNGPIHDLFIHINKNDTANIKNTVNSILEDYYTITDLNLKIPLINNITFNSVFLSTKSTVFNKENSLLTKNSSINFSFIKPQNSNKFSGKIDLTKSNLEYIPLNMFKPNNTLLSFDYFCELNDGVVYIHDIKSNDDFISFIANGFLNIDKKINEINFENISYNNSNYNLYYKSYVSNGILNNNIEIDGRNINYNNIFEKLKDNKNSINTAESNAKNKMNVKLNLKYLSFENERQLKLPILSAEFENNDIKKIDFQAKIDDKKFINLNFNKRQKMLSMESNDFGDLFQIIGLTDKIIGGAGEINFNHITENGKGILYGNIDITKQFKIITDENASKNLIPNIKQEKYFRRLTNSLIEDSSIRFDRMRGNISFSENILKFDEVVANSSFINLQILASGFLNLNTNEIKINGLLMPLGTINGLFGANRLPVISDIVFGQKDAGLFASKFEITKKNNNAKLNFKVDKFSMIMPGFLRNIFDLDTYKNTYHNFIK